MKIFKITYRFAVAASVMFLALSCDHNELDLSSSTVSLRLGGISDVDSPLTRSGETVYQERLGEDLWFTATVSDNPVSTDVLPTKGINTTESTFSTLYGGNGFKVYAENQSDSTECLFSNAIFTLSGTEWVPGTSTTWPAYVSDWYCWAPADVATLSQSNKTFTYTTPASNTSSDTDIMVSTVKNVPASKNSTLDITFKHALCEVRFVSTSDMPTGTLDSLCINGINLKGSYDFDNETWGNQTNPGSISLKTSQSVTGTAGQALTTNTQTFFVIPQTVGTGASLSVKYNGGTKHVIALPIGFDFPAGKLVTFSLGQAGFTFSFLNAKTDSVKTYTTNINETMDLTEEIHIVSNIVAGDTTKAAYWEIESYRIGSAAPVPVNDTTFTAGGFTVSKLDNTTLSATSHLRDKLDKGSHEYWVNQNGISGDNTGTGWSPAHWTGGHTFTGGTFGTPDNPIDLSKFDFATETLLPTMNTANCYIIRHAGTYMIPLVYGNAIYNGEDNQDSYNPFPTGGEESGLATFVNYLDAAITDPFIENGDDCLADDCAVVWQSRAIELNSLEIVGTKDSNKTYGLGPGKTPVRYLKFTVDENTICQANAIICIYKDKDGNGSYDEGEAIWSWHIWTTNDPDLLSSPITVNNGVMDYHFFPLYALGWTESPEVVHRDNVRVVLVQKGSNRTLVVNLKCPDITHDPGCTYYQNGRKDPMYPSRVNMPVAGHFYYNGTNTLGPVSLGTSISNPGTFYRITSKTNEIPWFAPSYYDNLWTGKHHAAAAAAEEQSDDMIKTIYDPSPVGYKVPASKAFYAFVTSDLKTANAVGNWNRGYEFYTDRVNKSSTIFFPAAGYVHPGNGDILQASGGEGNYQSTTLQRYFQIENSRVRVLSQFQDPYTSAIKSTAYGLSLRPVTFDPPVPTVPPVDGQIHLDDPEDDGGTHNMYWK